MRNITKQFPRVLANDDVTFLVKPGEIHALVGENGAGKSTLMNMLYGLLRPSSGVITIHGNPVEFNGPGDAIAQGIGMVHQHFMLIPPLTVAENVVLGQEPPSAWGIVDIAQSNKFVRELSDQYGLQVDPTVKVESLTVGIEQRVEILKVLYRKANILILDEPTAVLTPQEVNEFFDILRSLQEQGKTVIIITHKLQEVMAISDNVTVMRRGKYIGSVATQETSKEELANMMVGRKVLLQVERGKAKPGRDVLTVENIYAKNSKKLPALHGVSLTVRAGEILGLAGVEGNGQSELIEVITGLRKADQGRLLLNGTEITNLSPRSIKERGVGHIPEDRHRRGLILDYTVAQNMILGLHHRPPFVKRLGRSTFPGIDVMDTAEINRTTERLIQEFDVRPPDRDNLVGNASGGNQQKVVVAREFNHDPQFLLAAQPTRGVDVGSIEFIHRRLIQARDSEKAVLLISADLEEILSLSDRIAVIYEGKIVGVLGPDEATEERLGLMMTGGGE
ncbi:ABC transporter ATP-binding protein [candidate division KSB3 bacterium]|uniref:ABC transporter ATP-binding protein n=1 Tax=candidate division KSB3 bacterium TaxID=2044937 RepID=A0A2G6E6A8_9BACT|nr:MAG: ABC transporter ATP-binding protein [candidate division KSB3 bacterium]PIE30107.1 MAG: ABC transporter ATP-binding protein [candidate division KSB3 bacterium]